MSIDERLRLNIHTKLSELLGSDEADALMAAQLATVVVTTDLRLAAPIRLSLACRAARPAPAISTALRVDVRLSP